MVFLPGNHLYLHGDWIDSQKYHLWCHLFFFDVVCVGSPIIIMLQKSKKTSIRILVNIHIRQVSLKLPIITRSKNKKSKINKMYWEAIKVPDSKNNIIYIKTHGSVSCGPRSRRVTPVSILTGRKKTQFSHLRSSVLP